MFLLKESETFATWLGKLKDEQTLSRIVARLDRLASGQTGDTKSLGGGISELRMHFGPGYRIYFQHHGNTIILLLNGGNKSTQTKDIAKARRIAQDWKDSNA